MKKMTCLLAACVLTALCVMPAFAAETETQEPTQPETEATVPETPSNSCGEHLTWSYENGTLTITGEGPMDHYLNGAPWAAYKDSITKVVLTGGVTSVGGHAFEDYDKITEVDFGTALIQLGSYSFANCDGLTKISLPKTFKSFEESCLYGCSKLTEIHCAGVFPHFRENCLWNTYCKIYYPASAPWGVKYIQQLEEAFHGRIEFLASDGTDPYTPTEATEPVKETEAPTEAPTIAPTEAPTEAPTVAPTQAPTEAPTAAPTQMPTEAPTEAPTEPAPQKEQHRGGGKGGLIIIGVVLAFFGIGYTVFKLTSRGGKYSR